MPSMRKKERKSSTHSHVQPQGRKGGKKEGNQQLGQRHATSTHNTTSETGHHGVTPTLGCGKKMEWTMGKLDTNNKRHHRGTTKNRVEQLPHGHVVNQMETGATTIAGTTRI